MCVSCASRLLWQRAVHSGLSKGWNSWLNTLDEYERMRAVLRTAQNAAVGAQHAATEAAPIARQHEPSPCARESAHSRARTRLACHSAACVAVAARAWNSWLDSNEERAAHEEKMRACIRRAMNRNLVGALDLWWTARNDMRRMRKFGARLMQRQVSKAWASWLNFLDEIERLAKFARRMLQRGVVAALGKWCEYASQAAFLRGVLRKVRPPQRRMPLSQM